MSQFVHFELAATEVRERYLRPLTAQILGFGATRNEVALLVSGDTAGASRDYVIMALAAKRVSEDRTGELQVYGPYPGRGAIKAGSLTHRVFNTPGDDPFTMQLSVPPDVYPRPNSSLIINGQPAEILTLDADAFSGHMLREAQMESDLQRLQAAAAQLAQQTQGF